MAGTPISSNVFGPEPGGFVEGFVCGGPSTGVVGCDGIGEAPEVPGVVGADNRISGVLFLGPRLALEL